MSVFKVNIEESILPLQNEKESQAFSSKQYGYKNKKQLIKATLQKATILLRKNEKEKQKQKKIEEIKNKKQTIIEENNFESWRSSMKNKLILMTIMLIGILTMCTTVFAADLVISTAAELATFSANVKAGTTYAGQTIELANDIALSGAFTPIGTSTYAFAGTFDGKGYTISGLSINLTTGYNGLFGKTASTATVKNVTVTGSVKGASYTAGIVGYNLGNIDNCVNKCTITNYNTSSTNIGGIAGYTEGGTISNCINNGSITAYRYSGGIAGIKKSGVIIGCRNETAAGATAATIKGSYTSTSAGARADIAGIVGQNLNGAITDCYNGMAITGNGSYTQCVAGIVAYNEGTSPITNCHNEGVITGKYYYIAGIVGNNNSANAPIKNCSNKANLSISYNTTYCAGIAGKSLSGLSDVSNEGAVPGTGSGSYMAGIVGHVSAGGITNASNIGNITGGTGGYTGGIAGAVAAGGITNATNVGAVNGASAVYAGGIAGVVYGGISNAHSTGNVSGANYTGGVAGYLITGNAYDCSSKGTITGTSQSQYVAGVIGYITEGSLEKCFNDGNVSGYRYVGGICGYKKSTLSVINCRNESEETTTVKGTYSNSTGNNRADIGGIIGYHTGGAITDCYNNANITGAGSYSQGIAGIVAYTHSEYTSPITNCHNEGNISGAYYCVAGVVGNHSSPNSPITNCSSKGTINVTYNSTYIGGVAGKSSSAMKDVSNEGDVTGSGSGQYVGGVVGHVATGGVTNASNIGNVTGGTSGYTGGVAGAVAAGGIKNATNIGNVNGASTVYAGGVVGVLYGGISDSHNTGNVSGANYTGGVAAYVITGNASNCSSKGTITGTSASQHVGGVIGYITEGSLENCFNEGNVSGQRYVGGVCGYKKSTLAVTNCRNESETSTSVTGTYSSSTQNTYAGIGGVIGVNAGGAITDCYNNAAVNGNGSYCQAVAGIAGYNGGTSPITNCDNVGNVKGSAWYVAGVVGWNNSSASDITKCENTGNVTASANATYVGGVAGLNSSDISECSNTGNISGYKYVAGVSGHVAGAVENCWNTGTITGVNERVGGVAGTVGLTIKNCYNTGKVSNSDGSYVGGVVGVVASSIDNCYNTAVVTGYRFVGGVAGQKSAGTLTNSYSTETSSVTGLYSSGTETNYAYVGGVVGYNVAGAVTDCYNKGTVIGKNSATHTIGGVIGLNYGESAITNCDNWGAVSGYYFYIGGIIGFNNTGTGPMLNCDNYGTVNGNAAKYVGGVVGYGKSTMKTCYNTAKISGTGSYIGGIAGYQTAAIENLDNKGEIVGGSYAGGIAGYKSGTTTNVYNTATIKGASYVGGLFGQNAGAATNVYNTASVTGTSYVGGLAGTNTSTITSSWNEAQVTGAGERVGGIAGNSTSTISLTYNEGAVTNSGSYTGGIVGYNEGALTNVYNVGTITANINSSSGGPGGLVGRAYSGGISYSYNAGTVNNSTVSSYRGGVAGYSDHESYTNVYWLDTSAASGLTNKTTSTKVDSKMINELKASDMPDLLNASQSPKVWTILAAMNNGFPIFLYQKDGLVIPITITATTPEGKKSVVTATVGDGDWSIVKYEFYKDGEKVEEVEATEKTATVTLDTTFYYNEFSAKVTAENGDIGIVEVPVRVYDADIKVLKEFTDFMYYGADGESYENLKINLLDSFDIGNSSSNQTKSISTSAIPFAGTLDGNNNTVSGIYIDVTTNYAGLFGKTASAATIKNLKIKGSVKGASYTGALVGYNLGNIENCVSECTVNYYNTSSLYTGGLVGCTEGGTISNCINNGVVTGYRYVGGIAGQKLSGVITGCRNETSTSVAITCPYTNTSSGTYAYIGGVVGYNVDGAITDCYNNMVIKATGSQPSGVGGIVGVTDGTTPITNCHNEANVSTAFYYAGGIVGFHMSENSLISDCSSKGNISARSDSAYIGGIVGRSYSGLKNIAQEGNVTGGSAGNIGGIVGGLKAGGIVNASRVGDVTASNGNNIGGIVGYLVEGELKDCTNDGSVTGVRYVSGICGNKDSTAAITNCRNKSEDAETVTGTYSNTSYGEYAGIAGIVGRNVSGAIINCYNNAEIRATGSQPSAIGGIVGINVGTSPITNCHNEANVSTAFYYAGGIAGFHASDNALISNCSSKGNVSARSDSGHIGGIAGRSYSGLKGNTHEGDVTGGSAGYTGGIVGHMNAGELTDCINDGSVSGYRYVSGICGYKESTDAITGCRNESTDAETVTASYTSSTTSYYSGVAGIVGYNAGGTIKNCYNNAEIKGTGQYSNGIAGIVGVTAGTSPITNCHNEANVSTAYYYGGGIVGFHTSENAPISDCSSKGNVTARSDSAYIGGIVGRSYSGLATVSNEGNVIGGSNGNVGGIVGGLKAGGIKVASNIGDVTANSGNYVGGIAGYLVAGELTDCTNDGSVSGYRHIGGICGYKESTSPITGCRNESEDAEIITGTYTSSTSTNYVGIGGVVGVNTGGAITDCYNNIEIKGTGQYSNGVAGIVGYNVGTAPITNSHNVGNVTSTYYYTGGIVGYHNSASAPITKCSNMGSITISNASGAYTSGIAGRSVSEINNSYNEGVITGAQHVAGIVGHTTGSVINVYNVGNVKGNTTTQSQSPGGVVGYISSATIKHVYNAGTVTNSSNSAYVGGVAGYSSGATFTNTYYLDTSCSLAISNTTSTGTIAKTEAEMKTKTMATLLNDTQNLEVWTRRASQNNGYPILLALYVPTSILMAEDYDGATVNGYIFGNSDVDARRENIKSITFRDIMENEAPATYDEVWDVSQELDETVMLYLVANGTDASGNTAYDMYICAEGEITATDCAALLCQYTNCTAINNLPQLDVTEAVSMEKMFYGDNALTTVDISNLITDSITTMKDMFNGCHALTSIDVSKFNTENVTDMSGMFAECKAIQSLPLTNFKTAAVTDMSNMFNNCLAIKELKLDSFDTSAVTNMEGMFAECKALEGLDLSDFVVTTSTNVTNLLKGSSKLQSVVLGPNFNNLNGTRMFEDTTTLRAIILQKEIASETGAPSLATDTGVEDVTTLYVLNKTQEGFYEKATNYDSVFGAERIKPILGLDGKESVISLIGRDYTDIGSFVAGFKQNEATNYTQYGYAVTSENNIVKDTVGEYEYTYILMHEGSEIDRIARKVIVIMDNDAPTVVFTTNGTNAYMMNVATIVTVTDVGEAGVDEESLKYVWTESATEPTDAEFTNTFENGEELSKDEANGTWYLWVFASDNAGNTVKAKSESFYLDNVSPRGTVKIQGMSGKYTSSPELTVNLSTTDNLVDASKIKVALIEGTDDGISITNDEIKWQDYAETLTTEVSNTEGKKVIFVIFKDEAGNQTLYVK